MQASLIAALTLIGCSNAPVPASVPARGSDPDQVTHTPPSPVAPACDGEQDKLVSKARGSAVAMFSSMDGGSRYAASLEAWSKVSAGCRDGRWFYAGALLLTFRSVPLEASGTRFATVTDVLTAALAAPNTDDDELLARVAYNAAMGRAPASPADACARAKKVARPGGDHARYVCAQEALAHGDGKAAGELIAGLHERFAFVDADLVAARAAKLRGDKAAMTKFAAAAMTANSAAADRGRVDRDDAKLVAAAAKDLLD